MFTVGQLIGDTLNANLWKQRPSGNKLLIEENKLRTVNEVPKNAHLLSF